MTHAASDSWNLILSAPLPGAMNMAIDEMLVESVAAGRRAPTVRLYAWAPPCLSLGHAQPAADADPDALRNLGWDLVRRPTGGRAILHTDELTYSVVVRDSHPLMAGGVLPSYRRLSRGLVAGLEALGAQVEAEAEYPADDTPGPVCFEVPSNYEITCNGRKLMGSAQLRRRGVVLQHGSLPLTGDIARIVRALRVTHGTPPEMEARVRARAITLSEALGREVGWDAAAHAIAEGLARALPLRLEDSRLSEDETQRAASLAAEKYAHASWTYRL
jgi:lipoyl(octanoyl) transferase